MAHHTGQLNKSDTISPNRSTGKRTARGKTQILPVANQDLDTIIQTKKVIIRQCEAYSLFCSCPLWWGRTFPQIFLVQTVLSTNRSEPKQWRTSLYLLLYLLQTTTGQTAHLPERSFLRLQSRGQPVYTLSSSYYSTKADVSDSL